MLVFIITKLTSQLKKMNKKSIFEFSFLSEKPFTNSPETKLAFGHEGIVKTLSKIVKNSPEAFTIGLYGDWGSGKSTIACSLKDSLAKDDIPLIIFDVWKHEGDALRRTFLSSLVNQLKEDYNETFFEKSYELDERTNASKTINEEILAIQWKKMWPHLIVLLIFSFVVFLPIFIFYVVFDAIFNILDVGSSIGGLITGAFSLLSFSLFFKYLNQFIDTKKVVTNVEKFKDPQEFEDEFKKILKDGFLKSKLVIVFDNLDRVSGEKALEIMSTIKTFLDPIDKKVKGKNVVFIIPCDEKAIKRHIKKVLNFSENDDDYERYASEYLRKFFNTIIWIPEFYTNELEKLALDNLKATKIQDLINNEIAALIVLVFDKNPRQIIQYVNILVSNYLLIKERNIEGFDLKENIAQYAKYLIMIQRFPEIMELLREKMIYDLEDSITLSVIADADKYKNYEEFKSFLEITNHISIKSLDVFFKLRKNEFDLQFENSDKLIRLIESQEIKNIVLWKEDLSTKKPNLNKIGENDMNYIDSLDIKAKEVAFNQVVKQKISKTINPVLIAKFIDGLFYLTRCYDIKLNDETYNSITTQLGLATSYFYIINPENIIGEAHNKITKVQLKLRLLNLVKKQWVIDFVNPDRSQIFSEDYPDAILKTIMKNIHLFNDSDFNVHFKEFLASKYSKNIELFETISSDAKYRNLLGSDPYLLNVIINFDALLQDTANFQNVPKVSKSISEYEVKFFITETINAVLDFLNHSINHLSSLEEENVDISQNSSSLLLLFNKIISLVKDEKSKDKLEILFNTTIESFKLEDFKLVYHLFPFVYYFDIHDDHPTYKVTSHNIILRFLKSGFSADNKIKAIQTATTIPDFIKENDFYDVFFRKIISEEEYLEAFYQHLIDMQKIEVLLVWANENVKALYNFLEKISYAVPDKDGLATSLLSNWRENEDFENISIAYDIFDNLKVSEHFDFGLYSEKVIDLIVSRDIQKQEIGIKELNKNKNKVSEFNLRNRAESVLAQTFLPGISNYHPNVKNVFSTNFGGDKKFINDLFEQNENIKNQIINYMSSTADEAMFNIFKSQLFKTNYTNFCKKLLLQMSTLIVNDKSKIVIYQPLLELISSKYLSELKTEMQYFIDSYGIDLTSEDNQFLLKIEQKIK